MAQMHDTEGAETPTDERGKPLYDLDLWCDPDGPRLAMNVPTNPEEIESYQEGLAAGVFQITLAEVLEEYCGQWKMQDGAEHIQAAIDVLTTYAERFRQIRDRNLSPT